MKRTPLKDDYVLSLSGHFKGKHGYVTRVENDFSCVVWKDVWDFGLWVSSDTLHVTKRLKKGES